ncbi:MAG: hypothetical protein CME64_04100 [Halobacteriovoraceae bacterium]|nr:hypothetical protein [Halobacteriovoraceae bacterium]|tara:strand:+ start:98679 stop:99962 length:1284 start_codon:yes stop_codon:yes gene_type:complete
MTKLISELERIEKYHLKLAFPILCFCILCFSIYSTLKEDQKVREETHQSLSILLEPLLISGDLISIYRTIHSFEATVENLNVCLKDHDGVLLYGQSCKSDAKRLDFKFFEGAYYLGIGTKPLKGVFPQIIFILLTMVIIILAWKRIRFLIETLKNDLANVSLLNEDNIISSEFLRLNQRVRENQDLKEKLINTEKERKHANELRKIAHDLRSPVSVLEYLVEEAKMSSEKKDLMKNASSSIMSICSTLLTKSRQRSSIFYPDLLNNVVRSKLIEHRDYDLKLLTTAMPEVSLEDKIASNLERILSNIVNNSVEARKSTVSPVVTIGTTVTSQYFEISISDNGKGLSKAAQTKVFSPNFTTKKDGNGIGLYEARDYLHSIGGDIQIDSTDKGVQVSISLPVSFISLEKPCSEFQNYSYNSQHRVEVLH